MRSIKKITAVIAALCLALVPGCSKAGNGGNGGNSIVYYNDSNEYSQAAEGMENSDGEYVPQKDIVENIPTTPGKINESGEVSGFTVKLTDVYDTGILKADEIDRIDRQVLAFVYEVTNNTDTDMEENSFCMCIRYLDGEQTKIVTGVREMMHAGEYLSEIDSLNATIKPGETQKGYTAIALTPGWESVTLYYSPVNVSENDAITFDVTKDMVQELQK